jgi:hypothetical protein
MAYHRGLAVVMLFGGADERRVLAMAYDTQRKRIVLFGGSGASGETWEWDGQNWEQTAQTEGRFNPEMTYDAARQILVRFGGWTGKKRVADTWSYDGAHWTRLNFDARCGKILVRRGADDVEFLTGIAHRFATSSGED